MLDVSKSKVFLNKKTFYIAFIAMYLALIADTSIHVLSDIIFNFSISLPGIALLLIWDYLSLCSFVIYP